MQVQSPFFLRGHRSKYKEENVHHKKVVVVSCQKPFAHSICWKCLVKVFGNAIMASCFFPFQKTLEVLPNLPKKKKQTYVFLILAKCVFATTSFDLCMSKGAHNFECIVEGWGVNHGRYVQKVFMLQNWRNECV